MFHSSAQSSTNANMVAVGTGLSNQLTGASKDEFSKWQRCLRMVLNSMKVLDTESGDKVRVSMGMPVIPQNFGKSRGIVTQEMFDNDEDALRSTGFEVGDVILKGTDRRDFVKSLENRDRERKHVIASIILLAKAESPLYHVLVDASRASKDPNALIEAAELLFNAPCMATCLSIATDERNKLDRLRADQKIFPLPASRQFKQIGIETVAQFQNVFTDDQIGNFFEVKLRIVELLNFCRQIVDMERMPAIQGDNQALNHINQYVRGHKGPPLEYDRAGFWRDFDAHLVVFHEPSKSRGAKSDRHQRSDGGKLSPVARSSSTLTEEEASMVKHMHVLKKGNPGSKRHQAALAAIQSLGFKVDDSADTKDKGVCFRMRDTGECTYGKKCRYSHDKARIKEAKEAKETKATVSVFSVPEATNDSDYALHALSRKVRKTKSPRRKRVSYCGEESSESDDISVASSPRMIDYMIEGEWPADPDRGTDERHSPSVSMLSPSKKLKTKHQA